MAQQKSSSCAVTRSGFVLGRVFSEHAFVALQAPFAVRALGEPVGDSDLCLTAQALMVMPDWSLVVTTFSRQSWLLQRTATRVTSMATFVDKENPVRSANAGFMPTSVNAVFLDAPYANLPARTHSSVATLFARDGYRQRR